MKGSAVSRRDPPPPEHVRDGQGLLPEDPARPMADHSRPDGDRRPAVVASLRVGAIMEASLRIWRRDLRSLTVLAAGLEVPLVAADIALHVTPGLRSLVDDDVTLTGAALVVLVYGTLSHHFLAGLLERVVASERRGHHRPGLREVLFDLPWRRLVVADLLLTVMVVAGLALFVVPGVVALTWFSVTLPIVNLERNPVLASFTRSYRLVRGHSWSVFAVAVCAFAIPEFVIGAIASLTHGLTDSPALGAIGHAIPAVVLMPIAALPIVVLAFDLVDLDDNDTPETDATSQS